MNGKLLLVGAGNMAQDYANVLIDLNQNFDVVCRSEKSASTFLDKMKIPCMTGGIEGISDFGQYEMAIVATPVTSIFGCAKILIENGVKNLLL